MNFLSSRMLRIIHTSTATRSQSCSEKKTTYASRTSCLCINYNAIGIKIHKVILLFYSKRSTCILMFTVVKKILKTYIVILVIYFIIYFLFIFMKFLSYYICIIMVNVKTYINKQFNHGIKLL